MQGQGKDHGFGSYDVKGILLICYINKGKIETVEYYFNLLTKLNVQIHENRPDLKKNSFASEYFP